MLGQLDGVHPFQGLSTSRTWDQDSERHNSQEPHELYPNSLLSAQVYITREPNVPRKRKNTQTQTQPQASCRKEWTPH